MSHTRLRIAAPPRAVFDYLAEPRHRPQWQSSLRAVDLLTEGPTRVGTRWVDRTRVGASPRLEITAMTPPPAWPSRNGAGVWSEVGRWGGLTAALTLTFGPVPTDQNATDVGVRLDVVGTGPWWVLAMVLGPLAAPTVRADLRRAALLIEARHSAG